VRPQKSLKIDLTSEYPCPCRRRGRLLPIILTEAFGCDRCQQIFVLSENGQVIEQLSSSYPYKRAWRWTGYRWISAYSHLGDSYFPLVLGIFLVLLMLALSVALRSASGLSMIFWIAIAVLLIVLPALLLWLAYRR
jgi:hypothetical protein